ncbi:MAG: hypothetical protein VW879_14745, partial [Opitutae bacterium]
MRVSTVPKESVKYIWKDVERVLEKSVDTAEGKLRLIDVLKGILDDTYVLWVVFDNDEIIAAFTTRIIEYPQRRSMALDWVGGSRMKEWLDIGMEKVIEFASLNNCEHLEGYGRKAWGRALSKYGF